MNTKDVRVNIVRKFGPYLLMDTPLKLIRLKEDIIRTCFRLEGQYNTLNPDFDLFNNKNRFN